MDGASWRGRVLQGNPSPYFRQEGGGTSGGDHRELSTEKDGVECFATLHHNKRKTNLHIHMIFAERKRLEQPEEKTATTQAVHTCR